MENKQQFNWTQILKELKESGLSVKKFAEVRNINQHTLAYNVRKQREGRIPVAEKASRLIQVPVSTQPSARIMPEITLQMEASGISIKIRFEK